MSQFIASCVAVAAIIASAALVFEMRQLQREVWQLQHQVRDFERMLAEMRPSLPPPRMGVYR